MGKINKSHDGAFKAKVALEAVYNGMKYYNRQLCHTNMVFLVFLS